jgi:uncharacterized protein
MKRVGIIATLLLIPFILFGYTSPGKPAGFVNDFAKIISSETTSSLNQTLTNFNSETTIEIAVVSIPSLGDESLETYAVKLFEEWGIGKKGSDNGVLLLVAPNEKKVRIEVGYGLEPVLTDAQSSGIIQKVILPEFRNNDYDTGIKNGTEAIINVVKSEADYSENKNSSPGVLQGLWNFGFIFFVVLASILGRTKSWWLGGVVGAVAGIIIGIVYGFIFIGILSIVGLTLFGLLIDYIFSKGGGHGPHGPWTGGMGGGSTGGFGGFGGGRSGGGGSSGSW